MYVTNGEQCLKVKKSNDAIKKSEKVKIGGLIRKSFIFTVETSIRYTKTVTNCGSLLAMIDDFALPDHLVTL